MLFATSHLLFVSCLLTGSKRLHCEVSSSNSDARAPETQVTIVFEGGCGETTSDWVKVQRQLASQNTNAEGVERGTGTIGVRCVSYDRAGLGFSDAGPQSPTASSMVADLVQLLEKLQVKGSVLLVAHGAGALTARAMTAACSNPNSP